MEFLFSAKTKEGNFFCGGVVHILQKNKNKELNSSPSEMDNSGKNSVKLYCEILNE